MSAEDPYAGILLEMDKRARGVQPPGLLLGTVLEVGAGRLVIRAGGMELDQEDLLINARLLAKKEIPYQVSLDLSQGAVTLDVGGELVRTFIPMGMDPIKEIPLYELPGTLSGTIKGTVQVESERLAKGDQVLLLPDSEGQIYYVLCKVVSP